MPVCRNAPSSSEEEKTEESIGRQPAGTCICHRRHEPAVTAIDRAWMRAVDRSTTGRLGSVVAQPGGHQFIMTDDY
jgi:hypothetical protein